MSISHTLMPRAGEAPPLGEALQDRARSSAQELQARREARLLSMAEANFDFIWRIGRRMGLPESEADDVAQETFLVAARRLDEVVPGKERSYLLSVAFNLVRKARQRRARYGELDGEPLAPASASPDARMDEARARRLLDLALASLPEELGLVLVLHDIEEETMAHIALMLDLPPGTVASRLRRAREGFKKTTERLRRESGPRRGGGA